MPSGARHVLAALAVASGVLAAAALWIFDSSTAAGFALRTGIILAALWFAWPEITTRSPRRLLITGAAALILLLRPRSAWFLIPAFVVWMATARR